MALRCALHHMFGKHLLLTNTVTCGALMGLGDLTVQGIHKFSGDVDKIDYGCTGRMIIYGISQGPIVHYWYRGLDKFIPGKTLLTTAKKILADQLVASPFFIFAFFFGLGTLEGKPLETSYGEFKTNFFVVYRADWSLWPAAQFINFLFIPGRFRVLYVSVVTFGWNSFLAYIKHQKDGVIPEKEKRDDDKDASQSNVSNSSKKR